MTKLVDSAAGTFTASYDIEGHLTSEVYPDGMCANTSYDSTSTATSISYIKTRNCGESNPTVWFSDSIVPGIHGETLSQASTLASENYAYDNAGRLVDTQETPASRGCTTRLYGYDEESNRTSLTVRAPGSEGKCATEGGSIQQHAYDEANRLTDQGAEYETFGNAIKLPAADAGEHEINSTYYLDNQVATQEQNKTLDSYTYDPAGRAMETSSENTETKAKGSITDHYAGTGEAVTWTSEGVEKWSRNIPGIGGSLQATEEATKVVTLQLTDLQGNIVATAADIESETKLLSTYNSIEFGVPNKGKTPPKYAWLGASGLTTETAFGTGIANQGGASYVPQVARNLQTAPVIPPGAFPNGTGTGEQYGSEIPGWYITLSNQESAATLAGWTAEQEALAREAEQRVSVEQENEYYERAQALAEEGEAEEKAKASTASFKFRIKVGCLDGGFWTFCAGKYHGKWFYHSVPTYTPYAKSGLPTGVRVVGVLSGAIVTITGGGAAVGCGIAAMATPEDGQFELVPMELHCMAVGAGSLLLGGAAIFGSIFG